MVLSVESDLTGLESEMFVYFVTVLIVASLIGIGALGVLDWVHNRKVREKMSEAAVEVTVTATTPPPPSRPSRPCAIHRCSAPLNRRVRVLDDGYLELCDDHAGLAERTNRMRAQAASN